MSKSSNAAVQEKLAQIRDQSEALVNLIESSQREIELAVGARHNKSHAKLTKAIRAFAIHMSPVTMDWYLRPTKAAAVNSERTFCVRVLANYIFENSYKFDHFVVAETVNAVLDLDPESLISPEHVAKLVKDLR